ncbi:hypothetical protein BV25DRAFT_1571722 [Artomyces pyxidatus]|uniref:Uncharacterized protein n=1 Tax=Artomyces pyxidatus TaxID=48021 RepID=A0ACB8SKP4_9AGAM|nr:hypothetical protein BV25DRAFT_1571722 [Artomyces pyxidatus]
MWVVEGIHPTFPLNPPEIGGSWKESSSKIRTRSSGKRTEIGADAFLDRATSISYAVATGCISSPARPLWALVNPIARYRQVAAYLHSKTEFSIISSKMERVIECRERLQSETMRSSEGWSARSDVKPSSMPLAVRVEVDRQAPSHGASMAFRHALETDSP